MRGILAVWNDCAAGSDAEYERWYVQEHMPERLSVPGFRSGWRYEGSASDPRFFTYYVTDTPDVLSSPAYLSRLENPTSWTRRIMQSTFCRVTRTVCELKACVGNMIGSHVVTLRWRGVGDAPEAVAEIKKLVDFDGIVRAQLWSAVSKQTHQTEEARTRGGADALIDGALVVDCMGQSVAESARRLLERPQLRRRLDPNGGAILGVYSFLCMLSQER